VEGFSNTMLEAWAHGVPSVSAVDPDGVVVREGLGEVVDGLEGLDSAVRRMLADPAGRAAAGARARAHVRRHHAPDAVIDRLAALLDRVVAQVRSRRRGGRAVEPGRGS
jgi:glycosyltransferase involved in cell wall biosynthesis